VKLFLEKNKKLTVASALAMVSILALSVFVSPTFNLPVKAQGEKQASPAMAQEVQQKLTALAQRVRELGNSTGLNLTLPQGGNLTEQLSTLMQSASFSNLTKQLPQELSKLGLNLTNIKGLQQEQGATLQGLIQKLQNLTSSRGT
jgi:murein DD-endopeptidase MepM/ murein hydrolase activator NlpD